MKKQYISTRRLSLWMRLTRKWKSLYTKAQETTTVNSLDKLNNLSLLLGIKRKVALTVLAGVVTLGVQAQVSFEQVGFGDGQAFPTLGITSYSSPVFADIDGDGDADLVVGGNDGTLKYYTKASSIFTEQIGIDNPFEGIDVGYQSSPVFSDIDGDGDTDLIVGGNYGSLKYYTNASSVFTEQTATNNPFDSINVGSGSSPVFADIDGDGDADLIVGHSYGGLKYYTNASSVFTEQTGADNPFNSIDIGLGSTPEFADIDGDGDADLIIGEYDSTLNYYTNTSSIFTEQTGKNNPFEGIDVGSNSSPVFADIDDDGDADLIVGNHDGVLNYYTNASSVFTEQTGKNNPFEGIDVGDFSSPVFADIDGDGGLIIGDQDGALKYYTNASSIFTEQLGTDNPFEGVDVGSNSSPVFTDIDGDGDADLVVGENYGALKYYTNASNVFTEQTGTDNPFDSIDAGFGSSPVFADIDDDGDTDLIVGDSYGTLKYYTNISSVFTEQIGEDNPFDGVNVGFGASPVFADIDGDGDADLILGEYYGSLKYYTNSSSVFTEQIGTDNPFDGINVGYSSSPVFTDIDSDGDLDLFIGNKYGQIIEFRNTELSPEGLLDFTEHVETLNLYPNPATSIINTEEGQLTIIDLTGNSVLNTESTGTVDVSGLEAGIYIVNQNEKRTKLIIE